MIIEHKFYVGVRDINKLQKLNNTSLLSYLEDVACMHSEIAGSGLTNIEKTQNTWMLLTWKVKVIKRPMYNEDLNIKTWSRKIDSFFAYRDFNIYNENNELVAIASSKWVFINIEKGKIIKITDEMAEKYKPENISVFGDEDFEKIKEPSDLKFIMDYTITSNFIDVNEHLHNIYYMDIAKEALNKEFAYNFEFNEFEILYKHEIKLNDTINVYIKETEDDIFIVLKSKDEKILHAILKFRRNQENTNE